MSFDLKDYVEVADRIAEWYRLYPEGRILTEIVEMTDARVTVRAEVYREGFIRIAGPDDVNVVPEPPVGRGHSSLAIPGSTPYTKGSELENAETSAVGRALVMAGIPSKHVASGDEVRAKKSSGATHNKGASSGKVEGARTEGGGKVAPQVPAPATSEPSGAQEGKPVAPGGDDFIEKLERCYDIAGGSAAKLMRYIHDTYPAWLTDPEHRVGSVSDLVDWHLDTIIEGAA